MARQTGCQPYAGGGIRPFPVYLAAMTRLKVGQPAPNAVVQTLAGQTVELADYWRNGRHTLLIFLRHLA